MSATAEQIACVQLVELVTEYVEGSLDPHDAARFEAHIAACDGCRTYLDQMRQTIAALGHLPQESISNGARERLLTAFAGWKRGAG